MIPGSPPDQPPCHKGAGLSGGQWQIWLLLLAFAGLTAAPGDAQDSPLAGDNNSSRHVLTNTVQFKTLPASDYLDECVFQLQGVVTLVDTNRNLLVLQDATGALAVHCDLQGHALQVGQRVLLGGTNCAPYVAGFPNYPYRSSGYDVRNLFEGPIDWGEYHLTRMRACLHPPVSGEYTFWIASDNSSELWLSLDADPKNARKIASVPRYGWVNSRDWSKYPSQRSEPIMLKAGQTYYIEAFQEQTTQGENLAVAWRGPGVKWDVIDGSYLTPPAKCGDQILIAETNGILREYWTNYSSGDLAMITAPKPFESAVSVENAQINILGTGEFPEPTDISLSQPLPPENNFCWGQTEGIVQFAGVDGAGASLELSDSQAQIRVYMAHLDPEFARRLRNTSVRIEGVCEGGRDANGKLVPGILWAPSENCLSLVEPSGTNLAATVTAHALKSVPANGDSAMEGYFATGGDVTFNDHVFGKDYLFVQGDTAVMSVSLKDRNFENHLQVGQWIEMGGRLRPGKFIPTLNPLSVTTVGWRSLPEPVTQPMEFPISGSRDGRWTELEGVVRSVNTNGTMSVACRGGTIYLWVGQTPANELDGYVNARLRVRGVLSLTILDSPLLLIPSRGFVDVEEKTPEDPFKIPTGSVADLLPDTAEPALLHRAKVRGEVLYQDGQTFFIQDASGGVRAHPVDNPKISLGDTVEVVGFPDRNGPNRLLTGALFRPAANTPHIEPKLLDLTDTLTSKQRDTLVQVTATLLGQKIIGTSQLLELQEQQRVFTATISGGQSNALPVIAPGSRVRVTGICDEGTVISRITGKPALEKTAAGSLNLILRRPADLTVLSGPPWWTLKRTAALVGTLLTVLLVTLLWVYLLRRRLERQQAARLAFSRQMLQGQENERQRIAVNLHDSLGQNLLVIKNQARLAMQSAMDETVRQERLGKISEMTSQAIEEVRQITHGLRPYQLDRLGLTQAIRAIVSRASENSPILFASNLDDIDGVLDKESEIHVYRIIQESLNNILKHSGATEAVVVVKNLAVAVSLSIRDNGHGFDAGGTDSISSRNMGYGITGIRERVRILGGNIVISSDATHGTSIVVEIPKPAAKA